MSAETLRRAAALMRERAEAADTGTRWLLTTPDDEEAPPWTVVSDHEPGHRTWVCKDARHAGEHIASWHPAVALAVADWLDAAYAEWEFYEKSLSAMSVRAMSGGTNDPDPRALAVAGAYLGEIRAFRPDGGE